MARHMTLTRLLLAITLLGMAAPAAAVTQEAFLIRSGADLVALCATPASDPLYTAAVHMCHGFGVGTYQTIMAMTNKLQPIVCAPDPPVPRNEIVRRFLQWANDNPKYAAESAADLLGRFFVTQFPCGSK